MNAIEELTKLGDMLAKEDWFGVGDGAFVLNLSDKKANISIQYKGLQVVIVSKIYVLAYPELVQYRIYVSEPICASSTLKQKKPKSTQRAFQTICSLFHDAVQRIEEELPEIRKYEEKKRKEEQRLEDIHTKLGKDIFKKVEYSHYEEMPVLLFQLSKNYSFCVTLNKKEDSSKGESMSIEIPGHFDIPSVLKFIETFKECPEPAADRLLHGK